MLPGTDIGIVSGRQERDAAVLAANADRLSPAALQRIFPGQMRPEADAPIPSIDVERALREEIRRLRVENIQLRAKLCAKMGVAGIGIPPMESVVACFLGLLAETGYVTETGVVTLADLQSGRRSRAYSRPRHVSMWCVRRICRYAGLPQIAQKFAKADHTVVKHACTRIQPVIDSDPFWGGLAGEVLAAFGEKP